MTNNFNDQDDMQIIEPQKRTLSQKTEPEGRRRKLDHQPQYQNLPQRTVPDFLPETSSEWYGGDNMWKEFIDFLYKKQ